MTIRSTDIQVVGEVFEGFETILTPEALQFIEQLEKRFGSKRRELLMRRYREQKRSIKEYFHHFYKKRNRSAMMIIGPFGHLPKDLQDRRVEITGPVIEKWSLMH